MFEGKPTKLRTRLADVGARLVGFDRVLQVEKSRRGELERVELMKMLSRIEETLNTEISRRVDACKTMDKKAQEIGRTLTTRLQKKVADRVSELNISINAMNRRAEALEKAFAEARKGIPEKLRRETEALVQEVSNLKATFEVSSNIEKNDRQLENSFQLAKEDVERLFEDSEASRDAEFDRVMKQLPLAKASMAGAPSEKSMDGQFRFYLTEECSILKDELSKATFAREMNDDDIVQAINKYTIVLQTKLAESREYAV